MSRQISSQKLEFELHDLVSFMHEGERLVGRVVRVYNTRENYHVEVDGQRYAVNVSSDDPKLEGYFFKNMTERR